MSDADFDWLDAPAPPPRRARRVERLESEYQAGVDVALNAEPDICVWRQNAGKVRTDKGHWYAGAPPGAADLTGIVAPEGWRLEIELKARRGRDRAAQARWATFITRAGGIYVRLRDCGRDPTEAVGVVRAAIDARRSRTP